MIECICKYGRINEYKKLFLKAWDVPDGELFEPMNSDMEIMDDFVTGRQPNIDTTILLLQQRLFTMSPKTEKILVEKLSVLKNLFAGVTVKERKKIQRKKRKKLCR